MDSRHLRDRKCQCHPYPFNFVNFNDCEEVNNWEIQLHHSELKPKGGALVWRRKGFCVATIGQLKANNAFHQVHEVSV